MVPSIGIGGIIMPPSGWSCLVHNRREVHGKHLECNDLNNELGRLRPQTQIESLFPDGRPYFRYIHYWSEQYCKSEYTDRHLRSCLEAEDSRRSDCSLDDIRNLERRDSGHHKLLALLSFARPEKRHAFRSKASRGEDLIIQTAIFVVTFGWDLTNSPAFFAFLFWVSTNLKSKKPRSRPGTTSPFALVDSGV